MVCHYLDNTQLHHDIDLTLSGVNITTFIRYVHLDSNMKRNHYYLFVKIKMQGQIINMYVLICRFYMQEKRKRRKKSFLICKKKSF